MKPEKLEYVTPELRAHGSIRALTKEIDTSPVIEAAGVVKDPESFKP